MDLISPYINFGARYSEIPIRWISIFDELEKFAAILFQPSHLQQNEDKKKSQHFRQYGFCISIQYIMKHQCQSQCNLGFNSILFS